MKIKLIFMPALIKPNAYERTLIPPYAIYLLASIAKADGHNVSVIDPCEFLKFNKSNSIIIDSVNYVINGIENEDLVGFSCNSFNWAITRIVVCAIKEKYPNMKIVLGGLHPSYFDKHILSTTKIDYILRGEGERSLLQLLNFIETQEDVKSVESLSYRKNGETIQNFNGRPITQEELSELPSVDFSLLPKSNPYVQIPVESSRGCPYCCCFCSIPHRHSWRGLEPDTIMKRIGEAVKNEDYFFIKNNLLFVDDCFTIDEERAVKIFKMIEDKYAAKKKFFLEARISNIISEKFLQNINTRLISGMQIGVECGYDEGLSKVGKNITVEHLYKALDILKKYKCINKCFLSFIIGFPWEAKTEIFKTLNLIEDISIQFKIVCNINWLIYLPSELWENREDYGISINESIFDDLLWTHNKEYFFRLHPKVSIELLEEVRDWFLRIKKIVPTVSYNHPIFYK